jgi:hypothetical protein
MIALYHFKDGNSDKIWGWSKVDDGAVSFWGRTKGSLSFKHYSSVWDVEDAAYKKYRKGYKQVSKHTQETGPEVQALLPDDFSGQLMLAKLGMTKF